MFPGKESVNELIASSQENTTAAQWIFLNTEQALEDVVFFADSFPKTAAHAVNTSSTNPTSLPIHPSSAPWVFLGGSYPGVRGALLRQRNPSTIFASWASSAPVEVIHSLFPAAFILKLGAGAGRHGELLQGGGTKPDQKLFCRLGCCNKVISECICATHINPPTDSSTTL